MRFRYRHSVKFVYYWNLVIALLVLFAWLQMTLFGSEAALSSLGLVNLKFFTVLSNLLEGIASLFYARALHLVIHGRRAHTPHLAFVLKLISAVCVRLTFLVVLLFLGPMFGHAAMYVGANFWFHLMIPLLSMAEFVFLDRNGRISMRDTLWALLPVLLYGSVYLLNVLINGVGEWPHRNDFYGFATWGVPVGILIFAAILGLQWALALLLRLGNHAASKIGSSESASVG